MQTLTMRELRAHFRRMNQQVATFNGFFGQWCAHSQYGYALAWCATRQEAERAVRDYYADKAHLLRA